LDTTQPKQKTKGIHFKGLIAALRFDTTKGGVPKLTLRIAEHPNKNDPSITVWHKNVVATRSLAEKLNSLSPALSVGEEIEVKVGYPYRWPYSDEDGRQKVNEAINLWVVALRGQTFAAKRQKEKPDGNKERGEQTAAESSDR
jgi:hypothetical protein